MKKPSELFEGKNSSIRRTFNEAVCRKCLWCGKEAKDSPRDICWDCIREEEKENDRRDEIVNVGMMEDFTKRKSSAILGSIKSKKKAKTSRENGKKGGRPKKVSPTD